MHFAPLQGETDVVEGDRAAEGLADVVELDETHFHKYNAVAQVIWTNVGRRGMNCKRQPT
jgi:hypothetical protein